MKDSEPPSQCLARYSPMLVGRNSRGHWVVRSQDGLCGGLFVNRTEALRFALFENGHRQDAVILVPGNLELALNDPSSVNETGESDHEAERSNRSMIAPRPAISDQGSLQPLAG
jgi:hypothetical protein